MNINNNSNNRIDIQKNKNISTLQKEEKRRGYTKGEKWIILITILITLLGFLLRTWRIIREGMPTAFDVYYFQRVGKEIFIDGWYDLSAIIRDPPGIFFILVIAEKLFGFPGQPIMWASFVFPQIIASLQLIIFYVLARRLTESRIVGLLSMFFMSFIGMIVYRNQNVAPEIIVLGLVPFVLFFLLRYLETKDYRFLVIALCLTFAVVLIHHLTTLIVLVIWHVSLIYDFVYRHIKDRKFLPKMIIWNILILVILDTFVILFWTYILNKYPLDFITTSVLNLFPEGEPITPIIMMIVSIFIINSVIFSLFFYNFDKQKINNIIIGVGIFSVVVIFVIALFFGAASPQTSIKAALLLGTPAIVLPPLGTIGLTRTQLIRTVRGRMLRAWLFSNVLIISATAIFSLMSSLLGRLALYFVAIGGVLACMGIAKIISKINKRKMKTLAIIGLIGSLALTLTYSYPKPENNWSQQEIYWDAEFKTIDFIVAFSYTPNNTVLTDDCPITVDADLRLTQIIEGYGGIDGTHGYNWTSWLTRMLWLENESLVEFITTSRPTEVNVNIDYIYISRVMLVDGYLTDWANYGTSKDHWVNTLPFNGTMLPLNPYIARIYDTKITYLLYQII